MRRTVLFLIVPLTMSVSCSIPPTTREFLTKAIEGDNSEMRLGSLAETKGGPAVAAYGHTLEVDHSSSRAEAVTLASHYGISPPGEMLREARNEYKKLDGLSGNAFDKEFANYMIKDHQNDIADFTSETQADAPADVKNLASSTLPTLQRHLALAKSLK